MNTLYSHVVWLQTRSEPLFPKSPHSSLTLHVIQIGADQHLGLSLIGGHLLVDGRLQGSHAADADPLPQVIVAPLDTRQAMVHGLPSEPAAGRG